MHVCGGELANGLMVGGGSHWSFDGGVQRSYKPQQLLERKRKQGTSDEQSQQLENAFACTSIFRGAQRAARPHTPHPRDCFH